MEFSDLKSYHVSQFGSVDYEVWSPGRINLIGEHTDYNNGYVLPAAIEYGIRLLVTFGSDVDRWDLFSANLEEHRTFYCSNSDPSPDNFAKYLYALVRVLEENEQIIVPGFRASLHSSIPPGGGLSSSAALTVGFILAINRYGHFNWSHRKMAGLAQYTEHRIGAQVGIMDPYAIVAGQKDHFMWIDCRSNALEMVPARLTDHRLLLVDTGIRHDLADSEYNDRRAICEAVLKLARQYRDVLDVSDLNSADLQNIRNYHPEISTREVEYVLEENNRVRMAVDGLEDGRWTEVGECMYASHAGLRDQYRVSCPELDFLVDQARDYGVTGARMMGGGFGGSTINLIRRDQIAGFKAVVGEAYLEKFGRLPGFLPVGPADGGKVV